MKIVSQGNRNFTQVLRRVCNRSSQQSAQVEKSVKGILRAVEKGGDAAVARYALKFDRLRLKPEQF